MVRLEVTTEKDLLRRGDILLTHYIPKGPYFNRDDGEHKW